MKNSQISFVGTLLLVIIGILLVGGVIYLYSQMKQTNQSVIENSVSSEKTSVTQATTTDQTAEVTQTLNNQIPDLKTYVEDGFQIQYPSQYEVHKQVVAGNEATVSFQTSNVKRVLGINVTSGNCKDFRSNIKTSQVIINGTSFVKGDVSNDFRGTQTNASAVEYCAVQNGKTYKITPRIFFGRGEAVLDVDKDPIFDQMILSFKIIPTITTASSVTGQNLVMVGGKTAHIWGANLVNNGTMTTTVFIGNTKTSALPPPEISSGNGFEFTVPSSLIAGQSYDLYVTNNIGTSNVVRIKILASVPTSITPIVSYIKPTSVKVGDTITVYGTNLYKAIFSLDTLWGTTDNSIYYDPSGTSFSFVVPTEMKSVGTHSLQVDGASKPVTFTVNNSKDEFTIVTINTLANNPSSFLNKKIQISGKLILAGKNYFTDSRFAMTDGVNQFKVNTWLILEVPPPMPGSTGGQPSTMATYLDKNITLQGIVEQNNQEFFLNVAQAI